MNGTANLSMTGSFFRRYLLGESLNNILLRLTMILSAIILVWSGIMLALIIHTKCERRKQLRRTSNSHHHLYDSSTSLTRSQRNRRFQSSTSSLTSARCYSIRRLFSQLKAHCFFWPSSTARRTENSTEQLAALDRRQRRDETLLPSSSRSTSNKVQLVVEAMTRRPLPSKHRLFYLRKKGSFYRETDSSSGDESRTLYSDERDQPLSASGSKRRTCNVADTTQFTVSRLEGIDSFARIHLQVERPSTASEKRNSPSPDLKRLRQLHQVNTRATLLYHPVTRRLSSIYTNAILPPVNNIQRQRHDRPMLMISSTNELTSKTDWNWQHALGQDSTAALDTSLASSTRQIPLVMITDTSSSNTNIVELETFEDKHRLISDVERRLSRELRASYRPRHST